MGKKLSYDQKKRLTNWHDPEFPPIIVNTISKTKKKKTR
jgi:hypothetical protein